MRTWCDVRGVPAAKRWEAVTEGLETSRPEWVAQTDHSHPLFLPQLGENPGWGMETHGRDFILKLSRWINTVIYLNCAKPTQEEQEDEENNRKPQMRRARGTFWSWKWVDFEKWREVRPKRGLGGPG